MGYKLYFALLATSWYWEKIISKFGIRSVDRNEEMLTCSGATMTRMSLLCGMMVFLVLLNLQDATLLGQNATGLGQGTTGLVATGPPLNCGVFSTVKPTFLTGMIVFNQKKMLNRFIGCIGANSFMDIDGF